MSHVDNRSEKVTLLHVGIFLIIGSIFMIVLFGKYNGYINKMSAMVVESTAELVRFIEEESESAGQFVPEFRYVVDGVEYFVKSKHATGEKIYKGSGLGYIERICYNPENPEQSFIVGEEPHSATGFILFFIGILLIGILLVVIFIKRFITLGKV